MTKAKTKLTGDALALQRAEKLAGTHRHYLKMEGYGKAKKGSATKKQMMLWRRRVREQEAVVKELRAKREAKKSGVALRPRAGRPASAPLGTAGKSSH
jgi:hypothetical protein